MTTKVHALTDARGLPIKLVLTPGQTHDAKGAATLLTDLAAGCIVLGDKAYDANWIRERIEVPAPLMALPRHGRAAGTDQEVEVATGVGLGHVLGVELGPAAGQTIQISARRPVRGTARCGSPGSF